MNSRAEKIFLGALCSGFSICFVLLQPFPAFFQNDDFIHIPLSAKGDFFQRNSFRPVCDLSVITDYILWSKKAFGYHITNLLLHLVGSFLVFKVSCYFIEKYFRNTDGNTVSVLVALLFFVYAMHSEAVFWILGRSGILGLIFSLSFLLAYLKRSQGILPKVKYILLLFIALSTYESSFILLVICVLLLLLEKRQDDKNHLLLVFTSFAVYLACRYIVTKEVLGTYEVSKLQENGFSSIIINYGKLFYRCFIPAYTQGVVVLSLFVVLTLGFLLLLVRNLVLKPVRFLLATFLVSLLPYTLLGIDAHGYEGERYLYLPLFFLCLLMVLLLHLSLRSISMFHYIFLPVLLLHSGSLYISSADFRLAGNVNRLFITSINKLDDVSAIQVHQLPQSHNGALIMRDGLKEAIEFLNGKKVLQIEVVSKKK
jgi:hypothetical protein